MTQYHTLIQCRVHVKEVSAGFAHTIALDSDGILWGHGYNDRGQLGLGNRISFSSFQQIRSIAQNYQVIQVDLS